MKGMKLRELIETMKTEHNLSLCKYNGDDICECRNRSEGVLPYLERTVKCWYVDISMMVVIYLQAEEKTKGGEEK